MTGGEYIKKERKKRKLSQRALAIKSGVSNSTISRIEKFDINPDPITLAKLADALNLDLGYLYTLYNYLDLKESYVLTPEEGNRILLDKLKGTGLLEKDETLSKKGYEVISEFIASNAEVLKKIIGKDEQK